MPKKKALKKRNKKFKELKPEDLRWRCDPKIFEFDSTGELMPIEGIIGQERALRALKLGIDLHSPGYNIYIAGLSGTGKATTVKQMLETLSTDCPPLQDYAYVNNFKDDDRPLLLNFAVGKAKLFKLDFSSSINLLKEKIPQTLEKEFYTNQRKKLVEEYTSKEQQLLSTFSKKIEPENFSLGQVKVGEFSRPDIFPIIDDKPVPLFQLDEKVKEGRITQQQSEQILKKYNEHQEDLQILFRKGLKISQEFQDKLQNLEKNSIKIVVCGILDNLKEKYDDPKVSGYISQVEEHVLNNIQAFKGVKPEAAASGDGFIIDYFKEYEVNIVLDNSETKQCPIIVETSPSYINLFGTIEKVNDGRGGWYTDFTKIKAGSLLRANGGYLVLNVLHLFEEPGVWRMLKRVLTYRKLEIQDTHTFFQLAPSILKPEPIDIDTKIILIGNQFIYAYLSEYEYDFKKIFKVKADFDYEIKSNEKTIVEYARVIKKLIKDENLCEFDRSAIAKLIEISARFAGQKGKLTLRFSKIADVAREANYWACDDGFNVVSAAHVEKAFKYAMERHGLLESKVDNMIKDEMLLIDTTGERIGQINGLAIYGADFYSFGRPARITATISLGSGSIINVEREAGMSGRHYTKGVLIISGYFKEQFGQDIPLSFNANLVFEQSYGMVEGDSASCSEIFALLSTLAELPIKQSVAVTGSLNQKGDVQPIGGVNEKIEGFFDVCRSRGLTGNQGVIIPYQNIKELMLREDIIESVRNGEFHIYPISRVEDGIEILTGVPAGKKLKNGYEPGSVFDLVEKKIKDLYAKSKAVRPANNFFKQGKTANLPAKKKKR
jgi:ATP-dependent Lon protease